VQPIPFNPHILTSCDLLVGGSATSCQPIVTHGDGSPITFSNQAKVNEILVMYAVGLGVTVPAVVAGEASPSLPPYARPFGVDVGPAYDLANNPPGAELGIRFAGLAPGLVGVYQLNFKVYEPYDYGLTCSVVGPNLTFEVYSVTGPTPTDRATVCVQTTLPATGNAITGSSAGVPAESRIPKVLRDAFGPEPTRNLTQDPQTQADVPSFNPNFIPFPVGTDLRPYAVPYAVSDPASSGVPPSQRIGAH
jgi:hypothetical protein